MAQNIYLLENSFFTGRQLCDANKGYSLKILANNVSVIIIYVKILNEIHIINLKKLKPIFFNLIGNGRGRKLI